MNPSANARAAQLLVDVFRLYGLRRLLVVGGSPGAIHDLRSRLVESVELRVVDGTRNHDTRSAAADRAWAEVIAIWASTPLPHKVAQLFTSDGNGRVVHVPARGVAALCRVVAEKAVGLTRQVNPRAGEPRIRSRLNSRQQQISVQGARLLLAAIEGRKA